MLNTFSIFSNTMVSDAMKIDK